MYIGQTESAFSTVPAKMKKIELAWHTLRKSDNIVKQVLHSVTSDSCF